MLESLFQAEEPIPKRREKPLILEKKVIEEKKGVGQLESRNPNTEL